MEYIAFDNTSFKTEEECLQYEKEKLSALPQIISDESIKETKFKEFYNNVDEQLSLAEYDIKEYMKTYPEDFSQTWLYTFWIQKALILSARDIITETEDGKYRYDFPEGGVFLNKQLVDEYDTLEDLPVKQQIRLSILEKLSDEAFKDIFSMQQTDIIKELVEANLKQIIQIEMNR